MRHSSFLEVNLGFLQENIEKIKNLSQTQLIPMVKANAYGNGLLPISQFLVHECAIHKLGCASLGEALEINRSAPKLNTEILVFSDSEVLNSDHWSTYQNFNITPVIHQIAELDVFLKRPEFKRTPLVIKVNTGMNRLGISLDDLAIAAPKLKERGIKHLLTHFACSYYPLKEGDKTHRQMDEFKKALKILADANVKVEETSVSNSGAIEQNFGLEQTHIRPGLMMYGPFSVEPRIWNGHQISRFVTKVLKTFLVKKGTPVGYGINVAGEDGCMVVVPVGYGDGFTTHYSGISLEVKGYRCRVFGRVNMDMAFLMFPIEAQKSFKVDESIEIWGHDNRVIADIADQVKTHPYQIMCGITNRIPRIYKVK